MKNKNKPVQPWGICSSGLRDRDEREKRDLPLGIVVKHIKEDETYEYSVITGSFVVLKKLLFV